MVQIVSGEIAEDLATYMAESEQTNSALALGVAINRDCSVNAAGGYLVQVRYRVVYIHMQAWFALLSLLLFACREKAA